MDTGFIVMGTIGVLAYLSSQTPNIRMRHALRLFTFFLMLVSGAVVYHVETGATTAAAELWAKSVTWVVYGSVGIWVMGFIGNIIRRRGEMDNEKDI